MNRIAKDSTSHTKQDRPEGTALRTTVIIPNWNGAAWLENCIKSVQAQRNEQAEIVVVDNASTDGSERIAGELGVRVIRLDKNRGFAAAVNRGIAESCSEFVAVLNNDALLHPDWLATLVAALDRLPHCGMATGCVLRADSTEILDGAGDALSLGFAAARLGYGRRNGPQYEQERDVLAVSGTAALFRREVFEKAGGFEETFFAYLEDVDMCVRAQLAGFGARYVPGALAWHRGSATTGGQALHPRVASWITAHQLLLAVRFARGRLLMPLLPRILAVQLLWAARLLFRGRAFAWLRGLGLALVRAQRINGWHFPAETSPELLLELLRASEAQIFRDRVPADAFWRFYFRLFPCPDVAQSTRATSTHS